MASCECPQKTERRSFWTLNHPRRAQPTRPPPFSSLEAGKGGEGEQGAKSPARAGGAQLSPAGPLPPGRLGFIHLEGAAAPGQAGGGSVAESEPRHCGHPAREGRGRAARPGYPAFPPSAPSRRSPAAGPRAGRVYHRAGPSGLGAAPLHPRLLPGDRARTQLSRRGLPSRRPAGS